jgi:hypothetical protein
MFAIGAPAREQFEGNVPAELGIGRQEDLARSPDADSPVQLKSPEPPAFQIVLSTSSKGAGRVPKCGGHINVIGGGFVPQKGFHLGAY